MKVIIIYVIVSLLSITIARAQNNFTVNGSVKDSLGNSIAGATVRLVMGKDTQIRISDKDGLFNFVHTVGNPFQLMLSCTGFKSLKKNYNFAEKQTRLELPSIILTAETQMLQEVKIKAKAIRVKAKKDTLEYNAHNYKTRTGDRVDELLKQIPGIAYGPDGVSFMGKQLVKLRVNGKDFFSGDVNELIKTLPADIIDKIQLIDDYGDLANFTGKKNGESQKVINLVIKPNSGIFGSVSAAAGTNDQHNTNINANVWQKDRQISLNGADANMENMIGNTNQLNWHVTYRDKIGHLETNLGYSDNDIGQKQTSKIYTQTINSIGNTYTSTNSSHQNDSHIRNIQVELKDNGEKENFWNISFFTSFNQNNNNQSAFTLDSGLFREDIKTNEQKYLSGNNAGLSFQGGHKFRKEGRTLTATLFSARNTSMSDEFLNNDYTYYDKNTSMITGDSLINNYIHNKNTSTSLTFALEYAEPLDKVNSLSCTLNVTSRRSSSEVSQAIKNPAGLYLPIDSLSGNIGTTNFAQQASFNYNYNTDKTQFTLGMNAQHLSVAGNYYSGSDRVTRAYLDFTPAARLNYHFSAANNIEISYDMAFIPPGLSQLSPLPDTRNPQNITIGNPNLKPATTRGLSLTFNHTDLQSGASINFTLQGAKNDDQVVSIIKLVPDTLGSYRSITSYVNANGNYNLNANYQYSLPMVKNTLVLTLTGYARKSASIFFNVDKESFNNDLSLIQGLGLNWNKKLFNISGNLSYTRDDNTYTNGQGSNTTINTYTAGLSSRFFISERTEAGFSVSKTINSGYALSEINPLNASLYAERSFFKNNAGKLRLEANNLFNQENTAGQYSNNNTLTETSLNRIGRFFLVSFIYRLDKFQTK